MTLSLLISCNQQECNHITEITERESNITVSIGGNTTSVLAFRYHDMAILDGDIILGPASNFDGETRANLIVTLGAHWPSKTIPVSIDGSLSGYNTTITNALSAWATETGFSFPTRTTETDYVTFSAPPATSDGSTNYCEAQGVGYIGGPQFVYCDLSDGSFDESSLVHEIGHVLGLFHEHQRFDRDDFITLEYGNFTGSAGGSGDVDDVCDPIRDLVDWGVDSFGAAGWGPYDFSSVMHYPSLNGCSDTGSAGPLPTLVRNDGINSGIIDRNTVPSEGDICAILSVYDVLRYDARNCDGGSAQTGSCERTAWPYSWSCDGPLSTQICMNIANPFDPDSWGNNYLCVDPTVAEKFGDVAYFPPGGGTVQTLGTPANSPALQQCFTNCVTLGATGEPAGHEWQSARLCTPEAVSDESCPIGASYQFQWSLDGPVQDKICLQVDVPGDLDGWSTTYLCRDED